MSLEPATVPMRRLLIAAFCAFVLLSLSIFGIVVFYLAKQTLIGQAVQHLESVATTQSNAVRTVTKIWLDRLKLIASRTQLRISLRDWQETGNEEARLKVRRIIDDAKLSVPEVTWIGIIDMKGGLVSATEAPPDVVTARIQEAFEAGRSAPALLDVLDLEQWGVQAVMAAPMILDDELVGVSIAAVDPAELFGVTADYTGLGETGETLLAKPDADGDAVLMTPMRFDPGSAFVRKVPRDRDDKPVTHALRGVERSFMDGFVDYKEQAVLAVTRHLPEVNWGLVAKMDRAEALLPITRLRNRLLLGCMTILFLGIALAAYLSRRLTQGLADQETQIDAIVETAVDAIITIDDDGRIMRFNSSAEAMFGYPAGEMRGRDVGMLMPDKLAGTHDQHIRNSSPIDQARIRELIGKRRNGDLFPIELGLSECDVGGNRFFTNAIRDISERKEAEARREELVDQLQVSNQELARSNEALDRFAAVVAHDLNAPIRRMKTFSSFLGEDYQDALGEEGNKLLGSIERSAERAFKLIDGMLTYARLDKTGEQRVQISLRSAVDDAIANLFEPIEEAGALIEIDELPIIVGVESQLMQLFQNLINNALKFRHRERPPVIRIKANAKEENTVEIQVKDNGMGIRPEDQERIFDMLERLHSQDHIEGSGIGLATCRRIVENHGGRIWCRSEEGSGSTFVFTLDQADAAVAPEILQSSIKPEKSAAA